MCGLDALSSDHCGKSKMTCCTQGQSPSGSVVAMICCEVVCGESTSGSQFDFAQQTLVFATPVISYQEIEFDSFSTETDSTFSVFFRSSENDLLSHGPPDLFLFNSTFLI